MTAFVRVDADHLIEVPLDVLYLTRPELNAWLEKKGGVPISTPIAGKALPSNETPLSDTFAGTINVYSGKPAMIPAMWCRHHQRLCSLETHKLITPKPLWELLLRFRGHSLPRRGPKRRELITKFKERAKRLEHRTNIQTHLFIWNGDEREVVAIKKWNGKTKKWVLGIRRKKKAKKRKVVVRKKNKKPKRVRRKRRIRCKGCNKLFAPKTGQQKYCSTACGNRSRVRQFRKNGN